MGHVHLKVSDLERAIRFYTEVLGFELTTRMGDDAAFLSAGGYHHHIGLNTWESQGGSAPPPNSTGLYHFAILMPTVRRWQKPLNAWLTLIGPLMAWLITGSVRRYI